jgi:hypothetical protein
MNATIHGDDAFRARASPVAHVRGNADTAETAP